MPSTKQAVLIILILTALAFSMSAQLARALAPDLYPFISCNAAGNEKLTFAVGENVYGREAFSGPTEKYQSTSYPLANIPLHQTR